MKTTYVWKELYKKNNNIKKEGRKGKKRKRKQKEKRNNKRRKELKEANRISKDGIIWWEGFLPKRLHPH